MFFIAFAISSACCRMASDLFCSIAEIAESLKTPGDFVLVNKSRSDEVSICNAPYLYSRHDDFTDTPFILLIGTSTEIFFGTETRIIRRLFVKTTWFMVSLKISYKTGNAKAQGTKNHAPSICIKNALHTANTNKMHHEISGTQENLSVSRTSSPGKRAAVCFFCMADPVFFAGVEKSQSHLSIFRL